MMICHDMSFPESARCLMLNGARLILWPSNWSGWGEQISYTMIASRAIDNSVYLAFASRGQDPRRVDWLSGTMSRSAVFDPEGRIVCQKVDRLPGVVSCTIDLSRRRVAPDFTEGPDDVFLDCILRERRPDAYGPLTRPHRRRVR
jgi:predicted amidohydrolase